MNGDTAADGRRIELLSWNIHGGRDLTGAYDLAAIGDALERWAPDIACLQEVDREFAPRSDFDDQAELLADRLGMRYRFGATLLRAPDAESDGSVRRFGVATLCSPELTVVDAQHYLLPKIDYEDRASERRGLLETTIEVGGRDLPIFNTHLGLTEDQRLRQVRTVLDLAGRYPDPQVLAGDFNARPESRPIELLSERYELVGADGQAGPDATFPADDPVRRIDHVFVMPGVIVRNAEVRRTTASDHCAVACTIEMADPAPSDGTRQA